MAIHQKLSVYPSTFNFEVRDEGGDHQFTAPLDFIDDVLTREVAFVDKVIEVSFWDGSSATYQRGAAPIVTDLANGQRYQPVVKVTSEGLRIPCSVTLDGLGRGYIVR